MNVSFVVSAISLAASLYASLRNMRPGPAGIKGDAGSQGSPGLQGVPGPQGPPGSPNIDVPSAVGLGSSMQVPRYFREPVNPRRFRAPVGPIDSVDAIKLVQSVDSTVFSEPEASVSELTQWKGSPVSRVISPPQTPEECSKCRKNVVRYTKIDGVTICSGCK